jgi:hypothetical protein
MYSSNLSKKKLSVGKTGKGGRCGHLDKSGMIDLAPGDRQSQLPCAMGN